MRPHPMLGALALLVLGSGAVPAQGTTWNGQRVAIAPTGRRQAPACPQRLQVDHYARVRALSFDKASIGCVIMRSGNFERAKVVADSGEYVQVSFTRNASQLERTFWVPRSSMVVVR